MPQVPAECLRHRRAFLISAEATEQQLLSFTLRPPTQAELAMWERHVICGRCVAYTEPCTCKSEEDDEETACLPRLPNWRRTYAVANRPLTRSPNTTHPSPTRAGVIDRVCGSSRTLHTHVHLRCLTERLD
eukprot:GHVU01229468.1.p2 GENE.GHVU01229468.1~~GHVU01229468.1.p2  ORF type:complete len:131 (+),score=5.84 GHVU01229468.1:226-618(+)